MDRKEWLENAYRDKVGGESFDLAMDADPTATKRYAQWILRQVGDGKVEREDIPKFRRDLEIFHRLKHRMPERDINRIADPQRLYEMVSPFEGAETGKREAKNRRKDALHGAEVLFECEEGRIRKPCTEAAAVELGRGTRWCTAATDSENWFDHYSKSGAIYVIEPAEKTNALCHRYMKISDSIPDFDTIARANFHVECTTRKMQLHVPSGSFRTEDDYHDVDVPWFAEKFPRMWKHIHRRESFGRTLMDLLQSGDFGDFGRMVYHPKKLVFFDDFHREERFQCYALERDATLVRRMGSPSWNAQLKVLERSPLLVPMIRNPAMEVQMQAVRKDKRVYPLFHGREHPDVRAYMDHVLRDMPPHEYDDYRKAAGRCGIMVNRWDMPSLVEYGAMDVAIRLARY